MVVYVIDADAAIELASHGLTKRTLDDAFELFAPTLLRSQVMSRVHANLVTADGDADRALALADAACRLPRRLLGDAVLRETAWKLATEHGWAETYDAEYIALTKLHGHALIAGSDTLRTKASKVVPTETVEAFLSQIGTQQ